MKLTNIELFRNKTTVTSVLQNLLEDKPESTACILIYPDKPDETYSVRQLLKRATDFAGSFESVSSDSKQLVCICLYHGLDLIAAFIGSFLAGHIPTMIAPPSPRMEREKYVLSFERMIECLRPACVVTGRDVITNLDELELGGVFTGKVIYNHEVPKRAKESDLKKFATEANPEDIVLLQHSSGTTGLQKGVALSHRAVLNQVFTYAVALSLRADDVIVSWLPLYHDMGLIACFLLPLLCGVPFVQMSPFDWVLRPVMLLEAIDRYKGTLSFLPNFAYEFLRSSVRASQMESLSLSSLRGLINCSEPVSNRTHTHFLEKFQSAGIRPDQLWACYAMAENVFAVTQSPVGIRATVDRIKRESFTNNHLSLPSEPDQKETNIFEFVSCGRPIKGTEIRIMGNDDRIYPERTIGEICIRGNSLFDGYYSRDDLTQSAFTSNGWYKTGDLGYIADGNLFITGRKKSLIIVQGRNFYSADIEAIVSEIKGVIAGRVVALGMWDERLGTESITILAETDNITPQLRGKIELEIRQRVAQELDCTVGEMHFVPPRWLIKSTSGKISHSDNKRKFLKEIVNRKSRKNA